MKANEAPEKIYVHKSQYWGLMANENNITKNGIEYTRTDAFIEKACEWLNKYAKKYYFNENGHYLGTDELVEDFKLSMEL